MAILLLLTPADGRHGCCVNELFVIAALRFNQTAGLSKVVEDLTFQGLVAERVAEASIVAVLPW